MILSRVTRRLAPALLAAGLLSSVCSAAARAAEPGPDLSAALHAAGPHLAGDPQQARPLAGLIGTWDIEYHDVNKAGAITRRTGQFIASWVLDGRAVQDVWIVDASAGRTAREVYTDLRGVDPKTGALSAIFFDPAHASSAKFTAEPTGDDRIVMHSPDLGATDTRWSFVDIRPDSFVFRDESSDDGGKTWRLRSEDHATRRASSDAPLVEHPSAR